MTGMDDDYEALGFHHLDVLLPGYGLTGPILPGVDLTVWFQLVLVLTGVVVLGLVFLLT